MWANAEEVADVRKQNRVGVVMTQGQGSRMSVALLLCPLLCFQACATTSPIPAGAVLSRSVVEHMIELQADPETASHLSNPEEVAQLRAAGVIPVSVGIRNVGTHGVIVASAAITLEGGHGRVFPVAERVQKAKAPAVERPTVGFGLIEGLASGGAPDPFTFLILMGVVGTMPVWGPPVLITRYATRQSREQRLRNAALARLEPAYLAEGEAVGGVLYFAVEDNLPATLATATLIVPVTRAGTGTGEQHSLRLPLGKAD